MKDIIDTGKVKNTNGNQVTLDLLIGNDLFKSLELQKSWVISFVDIIEKAKELYPSMPTDQLLHNNNLQDSHWSWLEKAKALNSPEYLWFTLESAKKIEAAMIVCHPKKRCKEDIDIFYVDYFAVAPWNRPTQISQPLIKGLGTIMLKGVGRHISGNLSYQEGFSLHSLPQALGFYKRIGMEDFGQDAQKSNLHYLEMMKDRAEVFYHE
jgi:hypothetical protein